ncbi:hypothetical protein Dimus_012724 [Dionaea muscipula]
MESEASMEKERKIVDEIDCCSTGNSSPQTLVRFPLLKPSFDFFSMFVFCSISARFLPFFNFHCFFCFVCSPGTQVFLFVLKFFVFYCFVLLCPLFDPLEFLFCWYICSAFFHFRFSLHCLCCCKFLYARRLRFKEDDMTEVPEDEL